MTFRNTQVDLRKKKSRSDQEMGEKVTLDQPAHVGGGKSAERERQAHIDNLAGPVAKPSAAGADLQASLEKLDPKNLKKINFDSFTGEQRAQIAQQFMETVRGIEELAKPLDVNADGRVSKQEIHAFALSAMRSALDQIEPQLPDALKSLVLKQLDKLEQIPFAVTAELKFFNSIVSSLLKFEQIFAKLFPDGFSSKAIIGKIDGILGKHDGNVDFEEIKKFLESNKAASKTVADELSDFIHKLSDTVVDAIDVALKYKKKDPEDISCSPEELKALRELFAGVRSAVGARTNAGFRRGTDRMVKGFDSLTAATEIDYKLP